MNRATCAAVILLIAGVFTGCHSYDQELSRAMQIPDNLKAPRVVSGNGQFRKALFFSDNALGVVTDLRHGAASSAGQELIVAGHSGAAILGPDGTPRKSIRFDQGVITRDDVAILSNNDLPSGFLSRGSWSSDAILIDASGKKLWTCGGWFGGVDDAAAGDLNGDGKTEYVVGFNGGGGLDLLDASGKKIWNRLAANVWQVAIVEGLSDQPGRIIHSDATGHLIIRGPDGNVIAQYQLPLYLAKFSLSRWNDSTPTAVVATHSDSIYVFSLRGETLARLPVPEAAANTVSVQVKGTAAVFSRKQSYYAAVLRYPLWNRSILYIYDGQHEVVYEEILGEECGAIFPYEGPSGVQVLLGCNGRVLSYKPGH